MNNKKISYTYKLIIRKALAAFVAGVFLFNDIAFAADFRNLATPKGVLQPVVQERFQNGYDLLLGEKFEAFVRAAVNDAGGITNLNARPDRVIRSGQRIDLKIVALPNFRENTGFACRLFKSSDFGMPVIFTDADFYCDEMALRREKAIITQAFVDTISIDSSIRAMGKFSARDFDLVILRKKVRELLDYRGPSEDIVRSFVVNSVSSMVSTERGKSSNNGRMLGLAGEISGLHEILIKRSSTLKDINLGRLESLDTVVNLRGDSVKEFDAISDNSVFEFKFHLTLRKLYQQVIGMDLEHTPHLKVLIENKRFDKIRNMVYFGEADDGQIVQALTAFIKDRPEMAARILMTPEGGVSAKFSLSEIKDFLLSPCVIGCVRAEERAHNRRFLPGDFLKSHEEMDELIDAKLNKLKGDKFDVIIAVSRTSGGALSRIKKTLEGVEKQPSTVETEVGGNLGDGSESADPAVAEQVSSLSRDRTSAELPKTDTASVFTEELSAAELDKRIREAFIGLRPDVVSIIRQIENSGFNFSDRISSLLNDLANVDNDWEGALLQQLGKSGYHSILYVLQLLEAVMKRVYDSEEERNFVYMTGQYRALTDIEEGRSKKKFNKVIAGNVNPDLLANNKPFYDLACGTSPAQYFANLDEGRKYIFIDKNPFVIGYLNYTKRLLGVSENVQIVEDDVLRLNIPVANAGTVRLKNPGYHIVPDTIPDSWYERLKESVAPGGQVIMEYEHRQASVNGPILKKLKETFNRNGGGWKFRQGRFEHKVFVETSASDATVYIFTKPTAIAIEASRGGALSATPASSAAPSFANDQQRLAASEGKPQPLVPAAAGNENRLSPNRTFAEAPHKSDNTGAAGSPTANEFGIMPFLTGSILCIIVVIVPLLINDIIYALLRNEKFYQSLINKYPRICRLLEAICCRRLLPIAWSYWTIRLISRITKRMPIITDISFRTLGTTSLKRVLSPDDFQRLAEFIDPLPVNERSKMIKVLEEIYGNLRKYSKPDNHDKVYYRRFHPSLRKAYDKLYRYAGYNPKFNADIAKKQLSSFLNARHLHGLVRRLFLLRYVEVDWFRILFVKEFLPNALQQKADLENSEIDWFKKTLAKTIILDKLHRQKSYLEHKIAKAKKWQAVVAKGTYNHAATFTDFKKQKIQHNFLIYMPLSNEQMRGPTEEIVDIIAPLILAKEISFDRMEVYVDEKSGNFKVYPEDSNSERDDGVYALLSGIPYSLLQNPGEREVFTKILTEMIENNFLNINFAYNTDDIGSPRLLQILSAVVDAKNNFYTGIQGVRVRLKIGVVKNTLRAAIKLYKHGDGGLIRFSEKPILTAVYDPLENTFTDVQFVKKEKPPSSDGDVTGGSVAGGQNLMPWSRHTSGPFKFLRLLFPAMLNIYPEGPGTPRNEVDAAAESKKIRKINVTMFDKVRWLVKAKRRIPLMVCNDHDKVLEWIKSLQKTGIPKNTTIVNFDTHCDAIDTFEELNIANWMRRLWERKISTGKRVWVKGPSDAPYRLKYKRDIKECYREDVYDSVDEMAAAVKGPAIITIDYDFIASVDERTVEPKEIRRRVVRIVDAICASGIEPLAINFTYSFNESPDLSYLIPGTKDIITEAFIKSFTRAGWAFELEAEKGAGLNAELEPSPRDLPGTDLSFRELRAMKAALLDILSELRPPKRGKVEAMPEMGWIVKSFKRLPEEDQMMIRREIDKLAEERPGLKVVAGILDGSLTAQTAEASLKSVAIANAETAIKIAIEPGHEAIAFNLVLAAQDIIKEAKRAIEKEKEKEDVKPVSKPQADIDDISIPRPESGVTTEQNRLKKERQNKSTSDKYVTPPEKRRTMDEKPEAEIALNHDRAIQIITVAVALIKDAWEKQTAGRLDKTKYFMEMSVKELTTTINRKLKKPIKPKKLRNLLDITEFDDRLKKEKLDYVWTNRNHTRFSVLLWMSDDEIRKKKLTTKPTVKPNRDQLDGNPGQDNRLDRLAEQFRSFGAEEQADAILDEIGEERGIGPTDNQPQLGAMPLQDFIPKVRRYPDRDLFGDVKLPTPEEQAPTAKTVANKGAIAATPGNVPRDEITSEMRAASTPSRLLMAIRDDDGPGGVLEKALGEGFSIKNDICVNKNYYYRIGHLYYKAVKPLMDAGIFVMEDGRIRFSDMMAGFDKKTREANPGYTQNLVNVANNVRLHIGKSSGKTLILGGIIPEKARLLAKEAIKLHIVDYIYKHVKEPALTGQVQIIRIWKGYSVNSQYAMTQNIARKTNGRVKFEQDIAKLVEFAAKGDNINNGTVTILPREKLSNEQRSFLAEAAKKGAQIIYIDLNKTDLLTYEVGQLEGLVGIGRAYLNNDEESFYRFYNMLVQEPTGGYVSLDELKVRPDLFIDQLKFILKPITANNPQDLRRINERMTEFLESA